MPVTDLDSLPPLLGIYFLWKIHYLLVFPRPGERHFPVLSSRGCINNCSFVRMEKGIRMRSIENLFEELKFINSKYGVTYFIFDDEMLFRANQE